MPNGQPMSSWSATAFSRVFGESAARLPPGLPYRTIVLLPTAMEDRLGVELWRTRPAIPKMPLISHDKMPSLVVRYSQCAVSISLLASRAMSGPRPALRLVCASWRQHFCSVPPPGWLTVLLKSHFPRSNRPTFSLERCPLTRSRSVTSYSQAAKQNSTACEHMSRHPRQAIRKVGSILLRGIPRCEPLAVAEVSPSVHRQLVRSPGA